MDSMETADGQRRGLKLRMYDVKSMFTALPRTEILRAVDGLLALAAEQTWGRNARKRWIVVPKRRDEQKEFTCVTGSAAVADGQIHYGFTFQQIREVLVWDIHNVYFKVGAGYNIETSEWVTNGVTTVTCASEPDVRLWL